jgi:hypothetical protein
MAPVGICANWRAASGGRQKGVGVPGWLECRPASGVHTKYRRCWEECLGVSRSVWSPLAADDAWLAWGVANSTRAVDRWCYGRLVRTKCVAFGVATCSVQ